MNKKVISLIILVLVGGASFYGGMRYDQNKVASSRQARFTAGAGNFIGRNGGGMRGNGFTSGQVIAKDDKSITVKLRNSNGQGNNAPDSSTGSKIIFFSPTSVVSKNVAGSLDDVKIGEEVTVSGVANSDGSVNAETIQIRPAQTNK